MVRSQRARPTNECCPHCFLAMAQYGWIFSEQIATKGGFCGVCTESMQLEVETN